MNHFIRLNELLCEGNRLTFKFTTSLKVFKKKSFFVEYERPIQNPLPSINAIPFAAIMAPIAWATGCELILPELDKEYAAALERCESHFNAWFSEKWHFNSRLDATEIQNTFSPARQGMLFSGGLDSLTTYIRHKEKNPRLFTVFGADIPLSHQAFIASYKNKLKTFADNENTSIDYIYTDAREIWDLKRLNVYSKDWYGEVAHGLFLSSLIAPIAYASVKTLMLASCSHRPGCAYTCGSEKGLIERIRWAGTGVKNDNNRLSRVDKLQTYLKNNERYYSQLRVCWMQFEALNCGKCEKCLRTICELLISGIDPGLCNFKITSDTLMGLKKRIRNEYYVFFRSESTLDFWRTIQEKIRMEDIEDRYGAREFFGWFVNFEKIKTRQNPAMLKIFSYQITLKTIARKWFKSLKARLTHTRKSFLSGTNALEGSSL